MRRILVTTAAILLASVCSGVWAKSAATPPDNKALVGAAFDRWRTGEQSIFDLLSEDAKWTIVGTSAAAGTYTSREDFMARVIRPFGARMRDPLVPDIRGIYADGDMVIVFFDGHGVATDGVAYDNTYTWYMRVRSGRVEEVTAFYDSKQFDALWTRVTPAGAGQ